MFWWDHYDDGIWMKLAYNPGSFVMTDHRLMLPGSFSCT
jgi:hypothetical protein